MARSGETAQQDDSGAQLLAEDADVAHVRIFGRRRESVHTVSATGTTFGRCGGPTSVELDDKQISQRHMRLARIGGDWQLTDLESTNGGFINGARFDPGDRALLSDGAVIRIGDHILVFRRSAPSSDLDAEASMFPGISPNASAVRERIQALAKGSGHVLIVGETGTGKEQVAHALARPGKPFVALNCSQLSAELVRSELFGHVRGVFTGATADKLGLVDAADDGVLFLDEIGTLKPEVQPQLLRFLESGAYNAFGSAVVKPSKCRIVAATNVELRAEAANGRFRQDLEARLTMHNTPLAVPALRDRREDIPGWTRRFLKETGHEVIDEPWTPGALECLLLYPWDNNLRDLKRVVAAAARSGEFPKPASQLEREIQEYRVKQRAVVDDLSRRPLAERSKPTRAQVEEVLHRTAGNIQQAAKEMQISREKMYRLCKHFGIAYDQHRNPKS